MVNINIIKNILEDTWEDKCSNREIRNMVSNMSSGEKLKKLRNLTNRLEFDDYITANNDLIEIKKFYEEDVTDHESGLAKHLKKQITELEDKLFYYEKRIIRGHPNRDTPVDIDINDFQEGTNGMFHHQVSRDQEQQLSEDNRKSLYDWFGGAYSLINGEIYNTNYYKSHTSEERAEFHKIHEIVTKNIDEVINNSNGLDVDTILYRGGEFNIHLPVGSHFTWKGYTSTSYSKDTAIAYKNDKTDGVLIKCLARKGTKGYAGHKGVSSYSEDELEYLLGRGQGATVVGYDSEGVIVLLD